jgi:hypothetical protein
MCWRGQNRQTNWADSGLSRHKESVPYVDKTGCRKSVQKSVGFYSDPKYHLLNDFMEKGFYSHYTPALLATNGDNGFVHRGPQGNGTAFGYFGNGNQQFLSLP